MGGVNDPSSPHAVGAVSHAVDVGVGPSWSSVNPGYCLRSPYAPIPPLPILQSACAGLGMDMDEGRID